MTEPVGDMGGEAGSRARLEEQARKYVRTLEALCAALVGRTIMLVDVSIGGDDVTFILDDGSQVLIQGTSHPSLSPHTLRLTYKHLELNTAHDTRPYLPGFRP